ncbi:MAG: hypothetical protein HY378_01000 [Candidatus Brennerbacteria bacterium]|nr:hypothetical protein [Candidatus Brennerbacteria bacterium]
MELITFGKIFSFRDDYFIWLAVDSEEERLYLAKILNKEDTKTLVSLDKKLERNPRKYDTPLLAYVVLTTEDFNGCAATLIRPDVHADQKDVGGFNWLGELNEEDMSKLKKKILDGIGVPKKLVELIKNLGDDN